MSDNRLYAILPADGLDLSGLSFDLGGRENTIRFYSEEPGGMVRVPVSLTLPRRVVTVGSSSPEWNRSTRVISTVESMGPVVNVRVPSDFDVSDLGPDTFDLRFEDTMEGLDGLLEVWNRVVEVVLGDGPSPDCVKIVTGNMTGEPQGESVLSRVCSAVIVKPLEDVIGRFGYMLRSNIPITSKIRITSDLTVAAERPYSKVVHKPVPYPLYSSISGCMVVPRHYAMSNPGLFPEPREDFGEVERRPMSFAGRMQDDHKRQVEALAAVLSSLERSGGCVLSLPTGFGKTAVSIAAACHLGLKTLVLVEKEVLLEQWMNRIAEFVPEAKIGRIQSAHAIYEGCDFVVGTIQTVSLRYSHLVDPPELRGFGTLIVDECHHIAAKSFSKSMLVACCPNVIGLSATPERKDGLGRVIEWFLGPVCFSVVPDFRNIKVQVIRYSSNRGKGFFKRSHNAAINDLCNNQSRTLFIAEKVTELSGDPERHFIVCTSRVDHCDSIAAALNSMLKASGVDYKVAVYTGQVSREDKRAALEKPPGVFSVLVATYQLASEGLDVPTLNALFLASPVKSIQQVAGRIVRDACPKQRLIFDLVDDDPLFSKQYRDRVATYKKSNMEVIGDDSSPCPSSTLDAATMRFMTRNAERKKNAGVSTNRRT